MRWIPSAKITVGMGWNRKNWTVSRAPPSGSAFVAGPPDISADLIITFTEVVVERVSVCPIRDKKHANFNVWTACTTLAQILEKTQDPPRVDDPHIVILDRGIFDSICWITMMERLARIRHHDRLIIEKFLRADDWRKRISAVLLMIASPEDALKRELGVLPVEGGKGSIMNSEVLQQIKDITLDCADRLEKEFRVYKIDTSFGDTKDNPKRTAEMATDIVLTLIEVGLTQLDLADTKDERDTLELPAG